VHQKPPFGTRFPRIPRRAATALAGAALVLVTACGSARPQPLRIALDYTANVDYLGIYAAISNGYFAAAGIKAEIIPYAGAAAETLLASGKTDLGLTYPPDIPAYRAGGLDYEAVAGLSQVNTINIAVLASSKYKTVAELNGTLYGGFGVASDKPILEAVFRKAGVADPSYRTVVLDTDAYQALAAGRVAYSITYGGIDDLTAELQGVTLRQFPIKDYLGAAFSFPDDAFVATDAEVTSHAALLKAGLAALARGYEFAAAHPAAAEAILVRDNPTALAHSASIVAATGGATVKTLLTPKGAWGPMDSADFTGITQILVKGGLIKAGHVPAASSDFTNQLLPAGP
jgi:ABC-type nitrate/sulfonate/bicarbonate transport system substrate-binding protein